MLYELESPPYAQKSSSGSKLRVPNTIVENKNVINNTVSVRTCKTIINGIGFTSDIKYGPELPTNRIEKPLNGNSSDLNGSSILDSPPTSSESDSDFDNKLHCKNRSHKTEADTAISSTSLDPNQFPTVRNNADSPLSSSVLSTIVSSVEIIPNTDKIVSSVNSQVTKSLVPYESDDSSSSEDSNHSPADKRGSRVSTKAAVGEFGYLHIYL